MAPLQEEIRPCSGVSRLRSVGEWTARRSDLAVGFDEQDGRRVCGRLGRLESLVNGLPAEPIHQPWLIQLRGQKHGIGAVAAGVVDRVVGAMFGR